MKFLFLVLTAYFVTADLFQQLRENPSLKDKPTLQWNDLLQVLTQESLKNPNLVGRTPPTVICKRNSIHQCERGSVVIPKW